MKIAGLLPHLYLYGGVRRYIEIGNELVSRGHEFAIYTPEGSPPNWTKCLCKIKPIEFVASDKNDIAIGGDPSIVNFLEKANARKKIFYTVLEKIHGERRIIQNKRFIIMANSRNLRERTERKYKISCLDGIGGINTENFYPLELEKDKTKIKIMCYGRISRKRKGTKRVIKAVELLYKKYKQIELILFDSITGGNEKDPRKRLKLKVPSRFYLNLPQEEMAEMYSSADIFVSAEKEAGWSNTTAEAMACRVPVVCTKSGTVDFAINNETAIVIPNDRIATIVQAIEKYLNDGKLREKMSHAGYNKIQNFTWKRLCDKLENIFQKVCDEA